LSPKQRKEFERAWTLHRGFGACCDDAVFHLPGAAQAAREHTKVRC
jgi:hypothetical protein